MAKQKKWRVDDVFMSKLTIFLNQIDAQGGTIFSVQQSSRADHMIVVWYGEGTS